MNRFKSRKQAFLFVFESLFGGRNIDEILQVAYDRDWEISEYSKTIFEGVQKNASLIDEYIINNVKFWSKERLPKVTLAILKVAIYEFLFEQTVPISVSINEAVELAKKYGSPKEASYINGVLGNIAKQLPEKD